MDLLSVVKKREFVRSRLKMQAIYLVKAKAPTEFLN